MSPYTKTRMFIPVWKRDLLRSGQRIVLSSEEFFQLPNCMVRLDVAQRTRYDQTEHENGIGFHLTLNSDQMKLFEQDNPNIRMTYYEEVNGYR